MLRFSGYGPARALCESVVMFLKGFGNTGLFRNVGEFPDLSGDMLGTLKIISPLLVGTLGCELCTGGGEERRKDQTGKVRRGRLRETPRGQAPRRPVKKGQSGNIQVGSGFGASRNHIGDNIRSDQMKAR